MTTKKITLRAYKIENEDLDMGYTPLFSLLRKKLPSTDKGGIARDRCVPRGEAEDLISNFRNMPNYFFGELMRISKADDLLDPLVLESPIIDYKSIVGNIVHEEKACKCHFYFALNNNYLILVSKDSTHIKLLEHYLNTYLQYDRGNNVFKFVLHTKPIKAIRAGEIKQISFKPVNKTSSRPTKETTQKITMSLVDTIIGYMSSVIPSAKEVVNENFVEATLSVKFADKKAQSKEANDFLSAILTPMEDFDNITIECKNGEVYQGSQLLDQRIVEIEVMEKGTLNENQLAEECKHFLNELQ